MTTELRVKHINGDAALPKGAKPDPIVHQFLDQNGDPVDMSVGTWTGQGRAEQLWVEAQPPNIGTGSVVVNDVEATATYTWHSADFGTEGKFRLIIWVGNGTVRYGSTVYEWDVADAPGADPSV
jgi:hypothetical protein